MSFEAAEDVLKNGSTRTKLPLWLNEQYRSIQEVSHRFFDLPLSIKQNATSPLGDGYREIGHEYSQTPDAPDLNESFCVWSHAIGEPALHAHPEAVALQAALRDLLAPLLGIAQTMLGRVAGFFSAPDEAARSLDIAGATYLQVNRYRPADAGEREFLQDRHEDGHLLTLQHCPLPGLEIEDGDGEWLAVVPGTNVITVMAGELLTLMSGGRIPTVHHRVRRHADQLERISVMLFVTPTLKGTLRPWVGKEGEATVDVNAIPREDPRRFGLLDPTPLFRAG